MAEIAFHNVTKSYGTNVAVNDASFTVADNEFFCFFGPPLSGKSTILRLILGLEKPDAGEILIDGKRRQRCPTRRPQHRDGVPEPRPVPAYVRRRQRPLSPGGTPCGPKHTSPPA